MQTPESLALLQVRNTHGKGKEEKGRKGKREKKVGDFVGSERGGRERKEWV
jgi:hypothetical protein